MKDESGQELAVAAEESFSAAAVAVVVLQKLVQMSWLHCWVYLDEDPLVAELQPAVGEHSSSEYLAVEASKHSKIRLAAAAVVAVADFGCSAFALVAAAAGH